MVTCMPTLASDCCSASARVLSPEETVSETLRSVLPASLSSCLAFSGSPVEGIFSGSSLVPPASAGGR